MTQCGVPASYLIHIHYRVCNYLTNTYIIIYITILHSADASSIHIHPTILHYLILAYIIPLSIMIYNHLNEEKISFITILHNPTYYKIITVSRFFHLKNITIFKIYYKFITGTSWVKGRVVCIVWVDSACLGWLDCLDNDR